MIPHQLLINNTRRSSSNVAEVTNPATQELVARVCLASADDMHAAITGAERGARECAAMPAFKRAEILHNVCDGIRARREEIVDGIVAQVGKPIKYARAEVDRALITFTLAAEEATRIGGEVMPLDIAPGTEGHFAIMRRFPIGVIAAITPFNFPLNLVAHKVAPAFASGNSLVLKPPPQAPVTSLILGEIFIAAGAPAGALNIVPCENDVAEILVRSDRFAMLSFTGSAGVGWHLRSIAGKKQVVLELGGNAAVIVEDTNDLAKTAGQIAQSAFAYAGQVCISAQRIFVQRELFAQFCDAFVATAKACHVGDPRDASTVVGPLIDARAADRITQWLSEAVARGGKILCGGPPVGTIMSPTILTHVPPDATICAEEAFAPVAIVEQYSDFDSALARANDSRYGLQAGVYTDSLSKMLHAFNTLRTGGVIANNVPSVRIDAMPYGGVKDSGTGREGIRSAMQAMTEERVLVMREAQT